MVDIHCHILPGLDDGPKTLDEALTMVRLARESGTTDIVATPHANAHYIFEPEQIASKIADLQRAAGDLLTIHTGCDFHLNLANIQDALAHPTKYTINHQAHLLVEFSDLSIPPTVDEIFSRLRAAGMAPIVTHPERNRLLRNGKEQIRAWVQNDCLVQVTAQSFLGRFGNSAKRFADELIENGLIHFVATDGHDTSERPPVLGEAYRYVANKYGDYLAKTLFVTNPRAVLTGAPIVPIMVEAKKHRWYQFGKNFLP